MLSLRVWWGEAMAVEVQWGKVHDPREVRLDAGDALEVRDGVLVVLDNLGEVVAAWQTWVWAVVVPPEAEGE